MSCRGNRQKQVINRLAVTTLEETPFTANIGTAKATNTKHDWQTEALAAANANNANYEGDDVGSLDAQNLTTRLENICQIFRKTGGISETQDAVITAGRDDEMDRQKVMKGIELKRDIEARMIGNFASIGETPGSQQRTTGGALAWGVTNTSKGLGGSDGGYSAGIVAAAGNGTLRNFTEALVKAGMALAFASGGKPKQAYMSGTQKQEWSAFTGIAEIRRDAPGNKMATIIGAADLYVSDFGALALIPHPYGLTRDVLIIDPEMWAVATLRGMSARPLAKTGDSDRFMITKECSLVARNEKSSVFIRDVQ